MRTALADPTNGFNVKLAAIAASYGIAAFSIDWSATGSDSFLQSYVAGADRDLSRLSGISVALYTSASQQAPNPQRGKGYTFDGTVIAHLDFFVQFNDGVEPTEDQTENIADAIEDAILQVLCAPNSALMRAYFSGPVHYTGGFSCARGPIAQTEDGFEQLLPFTFQYEVTV